MNRIQAQTAGDWWGESAAVSRWPEGLWCQARRAAWRMVQRVRQRRALAALEPRLLRDIGLSAAQARAEAARPFWRD